MQRNQANTADEQLLPLQYGYASLSADLSIASTALTDVGGTVALSCGTWFFRARVAVFQSTTIGTSANDVYVRLWDGTNVKDQLELPLLMGLGQGTAWKVTNQGELGGVFQTSAATWKLSVAVPNVGVSVLSASTFFGYLSTTLTYISAVRLGQ